MKRPIFTRSLYLAPVLATITFLSGCAGSFAVPDSPVDGGEGDFGPMIGQVYGGHAPIVGAHMYVFQINTTGGGIGNPAKSLLGSGGSSAPGGFTLQTDTSDPYIPVGSKYEITGPNGTFALTNGYKCTPGYPVYLYAWGGAPTAPETVGVFNPAIVNLATLGNCPATKTFAGSNITYIYMNEVSTVATAYAFQGFTSPEFNDAVHIGYSGANSAAEGLTGIQNAAANTFQLYDVTGTVSGQGANSRTYISGPNTGTGVVPQTVLNTLANILASCVDSGNSATSPQAYCTTLFATATADGTTTGTQPTDIATAAINIARHPAGVGNTNFASTLWGMSAGVAPFSPNLANAPPDFTVAIQFPLVGPQSVATDSSGDFWFTTQVNQPVPPSNNGTGTIVEASPMGVFLQNNSTTWTPGNVVIDSNENAWAGVLSGVQGPVYEDNGTTFVTYGDGFSRAAAPVADYSGNVYFPHGPTCPEPPGTCTQSTTNPTLTLVNSAGAPSTTINNLLTTSFDITYPTTPPTTYGAYPTHGAIDAAGYDWLTSDTPNDGSVVVGNIISRIDKGTGLAASTGTGNKHTFPIRPSASNTATGACGTGWVAPEQPAIDRAGNAWIPIYGSSGMGTGVFVISPNLPSTASCPYYDTEGGNAVGPYGAAIDGSGNIWITNTTGGTAFQGSLAELNSTTGAPLSSTNYQPENQIAGTVKYLLNDPLNVAVDISGDVFVTNFAGNSVVELIGLATPVYGPLSVAAGANLIGQIP